MMALNRYRMRHLAKEGHSGAKRATKLLERPDRLLGVILIGNNFVNFSAASIATLLAIQILGEEGVAWAPVICTFVFLIFAEVAPKTIAANYPEKIALPSSHILSLLLLLLWPLVWAVSALSNTLLKMLGIQHQNDQGDHLSREELRTLVFEGAKIASQSQDMMLGVLDLDEVTVDDIMVPKSEIIGIDLEEPLEDIINQLRNAQHTRLPVFREDIDHVIGMLHVRDAIRFLTSDEPNKASLQRINRALTGIASGWFRRSTRSTSFPKTRRFSAKLETSRHVKNASRLSLTNMVMSKGLSRSKTFLKKS